MWNVVFLEITSLLSSTTDSDILNKPNSAYNILQTDIYLPPF